MRCTVLCSLTACGPAPSAASQAGSAPLASGTRGPPGAASSHQASPGPASRCTLIRTNWSNVINLLANAVDATLANHSERVRVAWKIADSSAWVNIDDSGLGIANTENLFVPFYTTKPRGSGVGLALAQQSPAPTAARSASSTAKASMAPAQPSDYLLSDRLNRKSGYAQAMWNIARMCAAPVLMKLHQRLQIES